MVSVNLMKTTAVLLSSESEEIEITAIVHCEETLIATHTTPLQVMEVTQEQHLLRQYPVMVDGH
jgi:hypothetical protein